MAALLGGHAAVAGGGTGAHFGCAPAQGFLGLGGQRTKTHAGDGDGGFDGERVLGVAGAQRDPGFAFFPVALQRVAGHAGAEQEQVVKGGQPPLGTEATNIVDALPGGPLDFPNHRPRKGMGFHQPRGVDFFIHLYFFPSLFT